MKVLWATLLALATCGAVAQQPLPGNYVTEGDWGLLTIEPGKFSVETIGTNGHTCSVEGMLSGRIGKTDDQPVCRIELSPRGEHWKLSVAAQDFDACKNYCGVRAWIEGEYWPRKPGCRSDEVEGVRKLFMQQYGARQFAKAAGTLDAVFAACGKFIYWMTEQDMRNDLALAHHHAGNDAACLRVLEPVAREYVPASAEPNFAPSDAEWGEKTVKKTRFNWKLCGGGPIKPR